MKKVKFLITLLLLFMPLYFINAADYSDNPSVGEVNEEKKELLPSVEKGENNSLLLSWNNLEGTSQYLVYRSTKKTSGFKKIKTLTTNSYTDTKLKYGTTYYYKVTAVLENDKITSEVISKKVVPNTVNNVKAVAGNKLVKITFNKTSNSGYEVYRSTDLKKWTKVTTLTKSSKVSYTNKSLSTNKTYYYKVRAYQTVSRKKVYGAFSELVSALTAPTIPTIRVKAFAYNQINVTIKEVTGAKHYQVQRSTNSKKGFKTVSKTESLLFEDNEINPTTTYYYRVRACNENNLCGSFSKVYKAKTTIAKPTLQGTANNREALLNWNNIEYADGYVVYYSTNKTKNFKKISTTSETSVSKSSLTPGKTYYFKVRTYVSKDDKKYYSSYSNTLTLKPTIKKVLNVSLTPNATSVNIKWDNLEGVTGYQIYRATSKKGTYKKIKTLTEATFDNTELKQKTTYYYKVRAYITVGKTNYYGSFSSVVSTKTLEENLPDYSKVMEAAVEFINKNETTARLYLRRELGFLEFSKDEVEYAIKNVDVNWKENVDNYLNEKNRLYSKSELKNHLKKLEFTDEEIEYGISNANINFSENALKKAEYYINNEDYGIKSRSELRENLSYWEFSDDEVDYAINNVDINWKENIMYILTETWESRTSSESGLNKYLKDLEFTDEEIEYGFSKATFDYSKNASNAAIDYVDYTSEEGLIKYLEKEGFTKEQIDYAMESINDYGDFSENAKNIANDEIEYYYHSLKETEDLLREQLFTEEQIQNAISEASKYNFNDIAFNRIFKNLDEQITKDKAKEYLTNAKFTSDEVNNAVEFLFKKITSTVDKINLNDPIMVDYDFVGNSCGRYIILKNPRDINKIPIEYINGKVIDDYGDEISDILSTIELDEEKMNNAIKVLNPSKLPNGMSPLEVGLSEEGGFRFNGSRLRIAKPYLYGDFAKSFNSAYDAYDKKVEEILKDAYLVGGSCGAGTQPSYRLTKELCDEYNLTCDAW